MSEGGGFNLDDRPLAKRKLRAFEEAKRGPIGAIAAPPGASESAPRPAPPNERAPGAEVVDVGGKPVVRREATATGEIKLQPATLAAIREKRVKKGDPLAVAEIAGIQAAKATPQMLPLCHPIPLTAVEVRLAALDDGVSATATVRAEWKTGVEMEALAAVTTALLCVWDMTKYLEKDERGQYPATRLSNVRVLSKRKGDAA